MSAEALPIALVVAVACVGGAAVFAWRHLRRREITTQEPTATEVLDEPEAESVSLSVAADSGAATFAADTRCLPDVLIDPRVRIDKAMRTLSVLSDGDVVKRYPVALGSDPVGPKLRAGDGRTPEGPYYVCTKRASGAHGPALGLSYPGEQDAERGLAERIITAREHRTILTALKRLEQPPWRTPLGGEILICGGGSSEDWTEGSVALDDADATELYAALPLGTPVDILP